MFEWKASNGIILGAEETGGKGRQFKARFLVPGLVKYDYGVCLLTKENADKFIQEFVGCPVVIDHQDVTDDNVKEIGAGDIFSVWFDDKDGYYWCNGIIRDKKALELINQGYSVSCQYVITEYSDNTTGALHNGNPYDKVIENGRPEHLAIVKNPRYEGAIIAVNAINISEENKQTEEETASNGFITIDGGTENERVIWVPFEVLSEKARKHILEIADNYKDGDETKFDFSHTRVKPTEEQIKYLKDTVKDIQSKYKFKGIAQIEISSELNKGSLGVCASPNNCSVVALSPQLYNGKYNQERWDKSVKTGFHPKGTGEMIKSVLVHELGHAITCNSQNHKFWSEIEGIRKDYMKEVKKKDIEHPDFISGYARTNKFEFVAEAFSQGILAKNYGKYTKKVMETIDKHFKSEYQTKLFDAQNKNDDNTEFWVEEYGLGYPIDEEAFEEFNKEQEKRTASNSFIEQFKDTLYTSIAEGIYNRLGELLASNEDKWITMHPHGKEGGDGEGKDYRRLLIKEGESVEDAMHRQGYYNKRKAGEETEKKEKLNNQNNFKNKVISIQNEIKDLDNKTAEIEKNLAVHRRNIYQMYEDSFTREEADKKKEKYLQENSKELDKLAQEENQIQEKRNKKHKELDKILEVEVETVLNTEIEGLDKDSLDKLMQKSKELFRMPIIYPLQLKLQQKILDIQDKMSGLKYQSTRKEVKEIAGVKRGKPMTFEEADNGNVNPNYGKNTFDLSYSKNCQSCVVCYQLRRNGFNVQTKGIPLNAKGDVIQSGKMYELAQHPEKAWINPKTGLPPELNICDVTTPQKAYNWLNENIKDGTYSFRVVWKGGSDKKPSGHIVIAYKENGNLTIYDPQTNKEYFNETSITSKFFNNCILRTKIKEFKPFIFRTDNLDINPDYADAIVKKA